MWRKKLALILLSAVMACGGVSVYASGTSTSEPAVQREAELPLGILETLASEGLAKPGGVVVLEDGSVIAADSGNHVIHRVRNGKTEVWAGGSLSLDRNGNGLPAGAFHDGPGELAFFNEPAGVEAAEDGSVYVADAGNHAVRRIDAQGNVTTIAGTGLRGHADGEAAEAAFHYPQDVAVTEDGTVYVADTLNHVVRRIGRDGKVTTIGTVEPRAALWSAGVATMAGGYKNGTFEDAQFNEPSGLALDDKGNLYVSDSGNHAIRYIDFGRGQVSTAAGPSPSETAYKANGLYAEPGYADGKPEKSEFHSPRGLAWSEHTGLIIADSGNHVVRALKNGRVSTVIGSAFGAGGTSDGLENEARLQFPGDAAINASGGLIVSDAGNRALRRWTGYDLPPQVKTAKGITLAYGSRAVDAADNAVIRRGTTFAEAGMVAELLGFERSEGEDGEVLFSGEEIRLTVRAGDAVIRSEAREWELPAAPYRQGGELWLPVRAFAEAAGKDVKWVGDVKLIVLRDCSTAAGGGEADGAISYRTLTLSEMKGTATVTQGGVLAGEAYAGMKLKQGDVLKVGERSSVTLEAADTGDAVTAGAGVVIRALDLYQAGPSRVTKLEVLAGTAYFDIHDMSSSEDRFEAVVGGQVNSVQGTHFVVAIDPVTGLAGVNVQAGIVRSQPSGSGGPVIVYPAQMITVDSGTPTRDPSIHLGIDINDIIRQADPSVIEKLLKNKQEIDQENGKFMSELESGNAEKLKEDLFLDDESALARYRQNVDNALFNLLKNQLDTLSLDDKRQIEEIIRSANEKLDQNKRFDLDNIPPFDPSAGLDPEAEAHRQRQLEQMKREKERREQDQARLKQEQQDRLGSVMNQIQQAMQRLNEQNEQKQAEKKKEAEEKYLNELTMAERERFERQREQAQQELQSRQQQATPPAPPVIVPVRPPVTPTPTPEPEPELVSIRFKPDESPPLAGKEHLVDFAIERHEGTNLEMPVRLMIEIQSEAGMSAEVAVSEVSEYAQIISEYSEQPEPGYYQYMVYRIDNDVRSDFTLAQLLGGDVSPAAFQVRLFEVGTYRVKLTLFEATESGLVKLAEAAKDLTIDPYVSISNYCDGACIIPDGFGGGFDFYVSARGFESNMPVGIRFELEDSAGLPVINGSFTATVIGYDGERPNELDLSNGSAVLFGPENGLGTIEETGINSYEGLMIYLSGIYPSVGAYKWNIELVTADGSGGFVPIGDGGIVSVEVVETN